MYTDINFKTKKALKEAVAKYNDYIKNPEAWILANRAPSSLAAVLGQVTKPQPVTYYQPNGDITGVTPTQNGTIYLEGPHYPKPHTWYAQATVKDGVIVKVK